MARSDGTDVSHWNGNGDWNASAAAGIWWGAAKISEGQNSGDGSASQDLSARNRQGMAAAGLRYRLMYHYAKGGNDPAADAANFLRRTGTLAAGEGAMLDVEDTDVTVSPGWVNAWCAKVEAATGRPVAIYVGAFYGGGAVWRSTSVFNGQRPRILAHYGSESKARSDAAPYSWDCWQWTGSGRLAGWSGDIDLDQVENGGAAFNACCGLTAAPVPPPTGPTTLTATDLANIAGTVRDVLNEGTPVGCLSWAQGVVTNTATLQQVYNQTAPPPPPDPDDDPATTRRRRRD